MNSDFDLATRAAQLEAILESSGDAIRDGVVVIVEEARHRLRRFPG